MSMRLEILTPERALEYLAMNKGNRPISKMWVDRLARAITNGEFEVTGDALKFNCDGQMLDGQHRCAAVVQAGIAIKTYVKRGLPKSIFPKLDQGRPRALSDVLACDGVKHYKVVASATKFARAWGEDGGAKSKFTNAELRLFLNEYPKILQSVQFVMPFDTIAFSKGMFAGLHFLFSQKNGKLADEFMARTLGGESITKDMIEFRLRKFLIRDAEAKKQYHGDDIGLVVIKAWNSVRDGNPLKVFKVIDGEKRPKIK